MYRTHDCGTLRIDNAGQEVALSAWVQKSRDLGGMTFVDLRDRYGITQLVFNMDMDADLCQKARKLGREDVVKVKGLVSERSNKNRKIPTGEIEIIVSELLIINKSETPPFTIEDETDGGDELRMKYRFLDLRRPMLKNNMVLRHKVAQETRNFLSKEGFLEIETPFLIKSTPEGARDFVVPSRLNEGQFYALPQSPQTFKQLLMVSGFDKYMQIVKCFRDEDLRADRQPEFTQIDCEMSFVAQEDILNVFEALVKNLFKIIKGVELPDFQRMTYDEAMTTYGSDKPDLRFEMKFVDLSSSMKGNGFKVFDDAESVLGIRVKGGSGLSRKQLDSLTDFVKSQQVGAKGMVYCKFNEDGSSKSSVDKFYDEAKRNQWAEASSCEKGDILLVLSGEEKQTRKAMSMLRLEMAKRLDIINIGDYKPLWVVDFPLLDWDEETQRWHAIHHPFTSPKTEDIEFMEDDPGKVLANAYDMVINGVEIGGGSIRIHDRETQERVFQLLGMVEKEYKEKFGFLLDAFKYGAPPHGGIALGFDRLCALMGGDESIRDYIAFPKNNMGRDMMLDAPSKIDDLQLEELSLMHKS